MKKGKRVTGSGATIVYITSTDSEATNPRFAFVVAKSVDKRATARNRIKRLLSESVRHLIPGMTTRFDCVVIGMREAVHMDQKGLEGAILPLLQKVGLLT